MSDLSVVKTAVLVSGGGSNLSAILHAQKQNHLWPAQVVLVISSRPEVYALTIAKAGDIPALIINPKEYSSDDAFQQAMLGALTEAQIQLVCLAGYLRRLSPTIIDAFRGRILNIHPALLPRFGGPGMYGHFVHEAVLKAGEKVSGCTVHLVDEEFDHGQRLYAAQVPVNPQDTPEQLAKRVLEQEHRLYPKAIAMHAQKLIGAHS